MRPERDPDTLSRMRLPFLTAVAAVAFLTGCSSTAAPAAAPPTPTPPPSSSAPVHLDERAACALLVPAVQDATTVMKDFIQHTDGSTVDLPTLGHAIDVFQEAQANGPADLQSFLKGATDPLVDLNSALTGQGNKPIQTMNFTLSAQAILDQCRPYTN